MVKQATTDDMTRLMELSKAFHSESVYKHVPFDEATVTDNLTGLIKGGGVFLNDYGFVAGLLTPLVFNRNILIAAELVWYCPQGDGRSLKDAFEQWAIDSGAIVTQFATLNNQYASNLSKYLMDDGYYPVEVSYVKGLIN